MYLCICVDPVDEWFDACDELGILGIIDMMYSTDGIFPGAEDTPTQEAEIRHQIRRMGHHPAIVVWSGCNECAGNGGIGHLIDVLAEEDQSRAVRAASPSIGFGAGVSTLTDFPSGGELMKRHSGPPNPVGERHGPYNKGVDGWASVNGAGQPPKPPNPSINASATTLAQIEPAYATGAVVPGYFVSETGATTMSSFESMSATLSEDNWGLHSPPMFERNYACDRWIYSFFRLINLNETGAPAMQRQIYFCLFGQALYMKQQIEGWRSGNIWGLLIWQYNEVWPTGGWVSVVSTLDQSTRHTFAWISRVEMTSIVFSGNDRVRYACCGPSQWWEMEALTAFPCGQCVRRRGCFLWDITELPPARAHLLCSVRKISPSSLHLIPNLTERCRLIQERSADQPVSACDRGTPTFSNGAHGHSLYGRY